MKKILLCIFIIMIIRINSQPPHEKRKDGQLKLDLWKEKELVTTMIVIGNRPQHFEVALKIEDFHLWLANKTASKSVHHSFNTKRSKTLEKTNNTDIVTLTNKGNEVRDIIRLDRDSYVSESNKFSFLLINKLEPMLTDGVLGLGREYPGKISINRRTVEANPRFSFIEYLYTNKIIDNKGFSIKFDDSIHGELLAGVDVNNIQKPISYCSPNKKIQDEGYFYKWNCAYKGIETEDGKKIIEFQNNKVETVVFESSLEGMIMNFELVQNIYKYLNDTFDGKCEIVYPDYAALFCPKIDPKMIPNLVIKFEDFDFKLSPKEIFEEYYDESHDSNRTGFVTKIKGRNSKGILSLGTNFWKYYEIYFDMENGKMAFSPFNEDFKFFNVEKMRKRFRHHHRNNLRWFHYLVIVFFILFIAFVIYYFYKRKQLKKKYTGKSNKIINKNQQLIEPIGEPISNKS